MNTRDQLTAVNLLTAWEKFATELIEEKNPTTSKEFRANFMKLLSSTHGFLHHGKVLLSEEAM